MKASRVASALAASCLLVVLVAGCGRSAGCKTGEPFCYCPTGASCTQECGGAAGCALHCANQNKVCTLVGGDRCTAACQNAETCSATCGRESLIACQYVSGRCIATVGDGSTAHCENAALCEISCTAGCDVDCPSGHCRVRCADPARCHLTCDSPVTTCPDGTTKVCGLPCL